jgi:hypothetical protein
MACLGAALREGGGLGEVHLLNPPSFSRSSLDSETISSFEHLPVSIYPKASRVASHSSLSLASNHRSEVALQDLAKLIALSRHASCHCCRGKQA